MKSVRILLILALVLFPCGLSMGESESIDNNGDIVSSQNDDDPMPQPAYGSSGQLSPTEAYNEEYDLPPDPEQFDEPEDDDQAPPSGGI